MIRKFAKNNITHLINEIIASQNNLSRTTKEMQLILGSNYRLMFHQGMALPKFDQVGFRVFSESDEDGILHYIFSLITTSNKKLVDIGAAAIPGSNTANLLINHGWTGLLIEGNAERVEQAKQFYKQSSDTRIFPPKVINAWITRENINQLLRENEMQGEIDLLSIDIDGIDYWVWQAIDAISPRVVVVEYQCIWGPEKSVTVPYSPDFKGEYVEQYGVYSGASLAAFVKLGKEKGYRLVGSQRYGFNAFFIRNDVGIDIFPEISAAECFQHPFTHWAQKELLPKVENKEWVEV